MEGEATTCWPKTIVKLPEPPERNFGWLESRRWHFFINFFVVLWVVVGDFIFQTKISNDLYAFTTLPTVQLFLVGLTLIVVLGFDLGSHFNFRNTIQNQQIAINNAVNNAVKTEQNNVGKMDITEVDKENLFEVLRNANLFNYRDTCILLRREFFDGIFSMIPWVMALVLLLSVKFNSTPPEGLALFVEAILFLKAVTIFAFWVVNIRLRTVKLYLFWKPVGR